MTNNTKRFNKWAKYYDRSLLQLLVFQTAHDEVFKIIQPLLKKRIKILDVACGTAIFPIRLKNYSPHVKVYGVDRSPSMIKEAKNKMKGVEFKVSGASKLPYSDNDFDVVICTTAFHHFPKQLKAIKEMYRVVKPGGRVIIVDGNVGHILGWLIYKIFVKIQEQNIYHPYPSQMRKLFRQAGFVNISQNRFNPIIPTLLTMGIKK